MFEKIKKCNHTLWSVHVDFVLGQFDTLKITEIIIAAINIIHFISIECDRKYLSVSKMS